MPSPLLRIASAARHPLHTVRAAVPFVLARPPLTDAWRTWARLWSERRPLTDVGVAEASREAGADARAPLRPVDVRVRGVARSALVVGTPGRLVCHTTADRRSSLRLWLAVTPASWDRAVPVRIAVRIVSNGTVVLDRQLDMQPGTRWRDRRWVKLAAAVHGPVKLEIEAASEGEAVDVAIGDPHVSARRTPTEVRALAGAFRRRVLRGGVRDAWRWMRLTRRRTTDLERYRAWCAAHTPNARAVRAMAEEAAGEPGPRFSILIPSYNTPAPLLEACVESVRRQAYPMWELVIADDGSTLDETRAVLRRYEGADARIRVVWNTLNGGIAANTQSALDEATGDFVGLLDADDVLQPHALSRVAAAIRERPDADMLYSDEDKLELDGTRSDPYFKPDWSPDLFLSSMYACHFLVVRREVMVAAGGFRSAFDGSQDYDMVLRVMDRTDRIVHVPDVLYHWRKTSASTSSTGAAKPWALQAGRRALQDYADRNALDATVVETALPGLYRMQYRLRATPLVSVVVPVPPGTGRQAARLAARLGAMRYPNIELVLAGPSAEDLDETAARATSRVRVVSVNVTAGPGPSARGAADAVTPVISAAGPGSVLNRAVAKASGTLLLFVEPWVEPLDEHFIDALVEHIQRPGVGIAGGKTFYPDGRLRHMGLVIGASGLTGRPFDGYAGTWAGYFANAEAVRNCGAVSLACLMTSRATFDAAGGFDEALVADGLDVDYALAVRRQGLRVVWTPFSRATEWVRAAIPPPAPNPRDVSRLRARWGPALEQDPYYSVHFEPGHPDYHVRERAPFPLPLERARR